MIATAEKASLISQTAISLVAQTGLGRAASARPSPASAQMYGESHATVAWLDYRRQRFVAVLRGIRRHRPASCAAAPSLTPGALPAVIVPSFSSGSQLRHRFDARIGAHRFVAIDAASRHVAGYERRPLRRSRA